jgi:hypothetical protein
MRRKSNALPRARPIKNTNSASRSASPSPTRVTSCWAHAVFPATPNGHTLESCLEQAEILSGTRAKEVFVDLGYRGVDVPKVTLYKARQIRGVNTRRLKRALKRRNAIELIIGHLKTTGYWVAIT